MCACVQLWVYQYCKLLLYVPQHVSIGGVCTWYAIVTHGLYRVLCVGPYGVKSPLQLFRLADGLLRGSIQISVLRSRDYPEFAAMMKKLSDRREEKGEGGGQRRRLLRSLLAGLEHDKCYCWTKCWHFFSCSKRIRGKRCSCQDPSVAMFTMRTAVVRQ